MEEQVEAKLGSLAKLVSGIEYGSVDAASIKTGARTFIVESVFLSPSFRYLLFLCSYDLLSYHIQCTPSSSL